ncbi:MAG: efflux RND transporter periplasmic adaptor subunit [Syntrophomonadaceae bacterium]|nr:efflux RND transporter periplasmic adaptor subunit [Syntrophomonadaceae bacterium]
MKKGLVGLTAALLLLSFAAAGCGQKGASTTAEGQAVAVKVAVAQRGEIARVSTLSGKLAAKQEAMLTPKIGGKVASVPVSPGDLVKKGQVIVQLEATDASAQLQQYEATLAMAQASYEEACLNLERMERLFAQGAASQQALDAARFGASKSAASVKQAQANVTYWRNQLANMSITAPFDGLVGFVKADIGETVGPSAPVASVVDLDTMVVECSVSESEINQVKPGAGIKVRVAAVSSQPFDGVVTSVAPAADPQSRAFPVKVEVGNPEHLLKSGMFAEIDLVSAGKTDALVIPKEAVVDKGEIKVVYLVSNNLAQERKVSLGISGGSLVEITGGLQEGDRVIVVGQNLVKDQTPVQIVE